MKQNKKLMIAITSILLVIFVIAGIFIFTKSTTKETLLYYDVNWNASFDKTAKTLAQKAGRKNLLVEEEDAVITVFVDQYLGKENLYAQMQYFFTAGKLGFISINIFPLDKDFDSAHEYVKKLIDEADDNVDISLEGRTQTYYGGDCISVMVKK